MENLSLIAAIGPNRELGYNNELLWHIKEDLAFYKEMTMGKNIIMGRLTLESMPKKALVGRKPIVLSKSLTTSDDIIKYFNHIDELLQMIENIEEEFMVIGGASIYKQFLPFVDTMYLTSINDQIIPLADCYFPDFNINDWNIQILKEGTNKTATYQIKKYTKKRQK